MPRVEPPAVHPMGAKRQISDIERFAKAYFSIELTDAQMQVIAMVASGSKHVVIQPSRKMGITTANKVILAYLQEGMKPGGRVRLPQIELPAHLGRTKTKAKTQSGRILELVSRPGGAFNFELSRVALQFCARIHELREDGHAIICERQYLKNGKASNTFLYRLGGQ